MPWFPEIAGSAFWDTIQLIGCGISTIALAAAARATGSFVLSIHFDKDKQEAVNDHVKYLGLVEYVKFVTDEPKNVLPLHKGVDFAFLSENSECYVELFDLLRLKDGAIIVADNALDEAVNEYIKHVRRQPGVHSSTLPLGRGIEVTKILSWNEFRSGVQRGRISTEEESIEDVFCVIDSKNRAPLDPTVWHTVMERMLERIIAHTRGNIIVPWQAFVIWHV